MNPFTTEEMNMICLYDPGNRAGTIYELRDMLRYLMPDETELRQLAESAISKLEAMSPLKVLTRGYSMVQTERGEVVRSVSQVSLGERIRVRLSDGTLSATVMKKEEGK